MEKKWKSPQTAIIIALILLIFCYIIIDIVHSKPKLEKEVQEVRKQYVELSSFLDKKIPEIDSTFKIHAAQLKIQKESMDTLKSELANLR